MRTLLACAGDDKDDLSQFVDKAVRGEILRQTVAAIQDRNADLTEQDAIKLANEAVNWARANRS